MASADLRRSAFDIIRTTLCKDHERGSWLGPEVSTLGIEYEGLDDISLDCASPLGSLYVNGPQNSIDLARTASVLGSDLNAYLRELEAYEFIVFSDETQEFSLTNKGSKACREVFKAVVIRKRYELKRAERELKEVQLLYDGLSEL